MPLSWKLLDVYIPEIFLARIVIRMLTKNPLFGVRYHFAARWAQVLKAKSSHVNLFNTFENYYNKRRL
jgi:hypothetical protein